MTPKLMAVEFKFMYATFRLIKVNSYDTFIII